MKTEELEKIGLNKDQVAAVMKMNGTDIENLKSDNQTLTATNQTLTSERDNYKTRAETSEKTLKGFEGKDFDEITKDRDKWKEKYETMERSQKEAEEKAARTNTVSEFLKDTVFVNDITKAAIVSQLEEELSKDTAKGKSLTDLFNSIVKDEKGNLLPNILIDEKQLKAEQSRSGIVGRSLNGGNGQQLTVTKEEFLKMGIEERTKLKETDPDTYNTLKGGR